MSIVMSEQVAMQTGSTKHNTSYVLQTVSHQHHGGGCYYSMLPLDALFLEFVMSHNVCCKLAYGHVIGEQQHRGECCVIMQLYHAEVTAALSCVSTAW